jgi:outer membrane murein-binding lipoprotein Lpp
MRRIWVGVAAVLAASLLAGCAGWQRNDDALCPGGSNCPVEE